jgi:ABC-type multidrug transport system fused ATPase/permease subunit
MIIYIVHVYYISCVYFIINIDNILLYIGDPNTMQQANIKENSLIKYKTNTNTYIQPPPKNKKFRFRFNSPPNSLRSVSQTSQLIIEVKNLSHGYNSSINGILLQNVNMNINKGSIIYYTCILYTIYTSLYKYLYEYINNSTVY